MFQTDGENTYKILAAYHQFHAVNKAVEKAKVAVQGDHKIGVVWHTQGSGKSLSMVFYAGKLIQAMNNPTIVVLTDRNDLDDQLFNTFSISVAFYVKHRVKQIVGMNFDNYFLSNQEVLFLRRYKSFLLMKIQALCHV